MPSQWMTIGLTLMEGVERTNVVVREQEQTIGTPRRNPYAIEVDRERNCYACRRFRHIARHCRNGVQSGRVAEGRRVEYGQWRREENIEHSNN